MTDILDELHWRGLIAQSTDESALRSALTEGVSFYVGFDPTAPSLHMGNLVQLLTARRLQLAGNRPFALVGGATGLIGDPRMSGERVLNSTEVVTGWVERIRGQVERFLDFDGPHAAEVVNNLDWTASMSAIDFLRDIGKNFRVNQMIAKEVVAKRLRSEAGISFTEFSYQILQANDFLQLHRRYGVQLQTGGSDQWGNLTAGVELVRRADGEAVHAMATPLITKADGTKFGKTESGTVWLDAGLTSPYAFFQFWLNTDDADVVNHLKVFTFRTREQIAELEESVRSRPAAREAQRALAGDVTTLVHGADATAKVIAASQALFGRGELADLDGSTLGAAVAELPGADGAPGDLLVDLFTAAGLVRSKSEARRAIAEGGLSVNNVRVTDEAAVLTAGHLLTGRYAVLRRGKRSLAVVRAAV